MGEARPPKISLRVIHTIHQALMPQSLLKIPLHRRKPVPTADMGPGFRPES